MFVVGVDPDNRNGKVLLDFIEHCRTHPEERFWQALRNWSGYRYVIAADTDPFFSMCDSKDTFYLEGKRHDS